MTEISPTLTPKDREISYEMKRGKREKTRGGKRG